MTLNTWWDGDPAEHFWMEITQRDALGENLLAPKADGAGGEQWSYTLVSQVRPGDRVLHYRTNEAGGGAIVGWSEATGRPSTGTITWQARGTRGRQRGRPTTGPSWYVPLGGFHAFENPVRGRDLSTIEASLFGLRDELELRNGKPVYFPFFRYRSGQVRAQQGYLVKFPAALLNLLPALSSVRTTPEAEAGAEVEEEAAQRRRAVPRGKLTRIQDPELRSAVEGHAVAKAIQHYRRRGCKDWEKLGKPYDIRLFLDGIERHVEVKGSTLEIETVELTINEVTHADDFQPTDLVVVDQIQWRRDALGKIKTTGGRIRVWTDWAPDEDALSARKFAYVLPPSVSASGGHIKE